ncbi:MAG: hypothetical protein ABH821_04830 [archaeon]
MFGAIKNRISNITTTASSSLSLLGGYNVCHNICLGLIALLSVIGISVQGMPLAFLQDYAVYLWSLGIVLLAVTLVLYFVRKCVSRNLLIFNVGLLTAAVPFKELEAFQLVFWVVGFTISGIAVAFYVNKRFFNKKEEKECCQMKTK